MSNDSISTRRRFFWQAGAALSAPLAASTALGEGSSGDAAHERLAALEDERAIRALNQQYAELVAARAYAELAALHAEPSAFRLEERVRAIVPDSFGAADAIELAPDRATAASRIRCVVHVETAIGPSCTLVEMARQQGDGVLKSTERRVLEHEYVKRGGVWKIARSSYRAV